MTMKHPVEQLLGLYALSPGLVRDAAALEAHLSVCDACRSQLAEIRADDAALREPETWLAAAGIAPDDELRAFDTRAGGEDAAALELLRPFESPEAAAHFVWEDVTRKPEFRTGGVARRLCKLANGMCERQPLYALSLAEAATRIAALLPDTSYPRGTIHELRGEAWKEQANAFRYLGRFTDAHTALDAAEEEYCQLPVEGVGLVAVQYVRAYVLYEQEQLDAAEALAYQSAAGALQLGETDRYTRALHLQGEILYERRSFAEAAAIFASILDYGERRKEMVWVARESINLGQCHLELRRLPEASRLLHRALRLFTDLRLESEVTRTGWAIGRLLFAEGNSREATQRLREAIRELSRSGMLTDAALAAIDLAEMLTVLGRVREIPKVLSGVVQTFTAAGKLTGALTALAYLKDAATAGRIAPAMFPHVRRFLVRAERQPELLFLPPPAV
jgi:tetratricopeptide (TPR) repeat protein